MPTALSRAPAPRVSPAAQAAVPLALVIGTLLAACEGGGTAGPGEPPSATPAADTVFMPGTAFSPFVVTIRAGASVAWDFPREAHNVIFPKQPNGQPRVAGSPADILPTSNRVVTRQFTVPGTFPYDCTLHQGMRGEVVVER